jgi:nucleotide-binding universal stress UspA family protein
MKKILIAVDYNPSAEKVAETGYAMAKSLGAEVTIVHVITDAAYYAIDYSPIMGYQGGYTAGTMELIEDIKKEAELYLAASVKHLGDSQIKTVVLEGDTIDSILTYSQDWPADLIVMGSHSHRGLERLFVSDVATHVLKQSKIPLLIIPVEDK